MVKKAEKNAMGGENLRRGGGRVRRKEREGKTNSKGKTKAKASKSATPKKKIIRKKIAVKKSGKNESKKSNENENKKPVEKQAKNRRKNGQFANGNKLGIRWKPGESGNPAGRPKGRLITDILREHLFEAVKDEKGNVIELAPGIPVTKADLIVAKLVERAEDGSFYHMKEVLERIDGKVPNKLDAVVRDKANISELMLAAGRGELPEDEE